MHESITFAILEYQKTGKGLESIIQKISTDIYLYPRKRFCWDEDDSSDFFCYFYPKIPGLVSRFQFTGKPFEAYLSTTLKWQLKTFASEKKRRSAMYRILNNEEFWYIKEETSLYTEKPDLNIPPSVKKVLKVSSNNRVNDLSSRRRILYLAMKGSLQITGHLIECVSIITGYKQDWLFDCIEKLTSRMEARKKRIAALEAKRNKSLFKIFYLHEQLVKEYENENRSRVFLELIKEKKRIAEAMDEISRVPLTPTHRDIAEVLGVPKGSVDSGLYYLKNAFKEVFCTTNN
ncbi:MAG: hypothetical protein AB1798_12375 [Spirochaetota bacterium]